MTTTIITKNSSTAGAAPLAADLVQGELAVNVTSKALYTKNASAAIVKLNTPSIVDNGDATAITIDSSENVGIGTSSPTKKLEVGSLGAFRLQTGSTTLDCTPTAGATDGFVWNTSAASYYDWAYAGSVKMRIDSSGNLLVGTTSGSNRLLVSDANDRTSATAQLRVEGNGYSMVSWLDATACYLGQNSVGRALRLYSGASTAGVNLAAGGTSWGTYSDERLKYDIEPITCALEKVANIRCVSYRLKDIDDPFSQKKIGVIAQDLIGKMDEVLDRTKRSDEDPTEYLAVRYSEIVPVLMKAIQEQQALITQLQADVAALKGQA